jgi:CheY-like chemotaxis protein
MFGERNQCRRASTSERLQIGAQAEIDPEQEVVQEALDYRCPPTPNTHVRTTTQKPTLGKSQSMCRSTMSASIRVLVVDDSLPFREATRDLIEGTPGFEWIGDANCGEEGIEQAARLAPDLVLMDVRMPGIGGVEAARRISARRGPSIVVLVTGTEITTDLANEAAAEVLPKRRLNAASLRRLWQDHERPTG